MRRTFAILIVPLLILVAFFAVEQTIRVKGVLAVSPPPVEDHGAPPPSHEAAAAAVPSTAREESSSALVPVVRRIDRQARAAERARSLLASLRSWASSDAQVFPTLEIEEVRDLLTRHPEVAEYFMAALVDEGDLRLRMYLLFAFHKVEDEKLRAELLAAYRKTDRSKSRLAEILIDRSLVLATLRGAPEPRLCADLVNRMGQGLLADPDVASELLRIAMEEPDDLTRTRAIARLGDLDGPEARELLFEILADPTRALRDRQSAAQQLRNVPCDRAVASFIEILDGQEDASLQRFAALGLRKAGRNSEARRALLNLLRDEKGDLQARKNSATALASCLCALEGTDRRELEEVLRGTLDGIARGQSSSALTVHSMSVLSRALGTEFHAELREFFDKASSELQRMMLDHPTLKRVLET